MRLILVTGFLGTGKTTLLLEFAKFLRHQTGANIAVIENEIGKVGIDDHLLRGEQLQVREIYSGCICCSLRVDLITTLLALEREIKPDIVLLEPSGVAGPIQVLRALEGYGGEIESKTLFSVMDAPRFLDGKPLSLPIVTDGIRAANAVLINKIDSVSETAWHELRERVQALRPGVPVFPVCALCPETLAPLLTFLAESAPVATTCPEPAALDPATPKPVVAARELTLAVSSADRELLCRAVTALLADLATCLHAAGCPLLGHLKTVLRTGDGGYWFASVTEFAAQPRSRGHLPDRAGTLRFVLNAIVYGVAECTLSRLVDGALRRHLAPWNETPSEKP